MVYLSVGVWQATWCLTFVNLECCGHHPSIRVGPRWVGTTRQLKRRGEWVMGMGWVKCKSGDRWVGGGLWDGWWRVELISAKLSRSVRSFARSCLTLGRTLSVWWEEDKGTYLTTICGLLTFCFMLTVCWLNKLPTMSDGILIMKLTTRVINIQRRRKIDTVCGWKYCWSIILIHCERGLMSLFFNSPGHGNNVKRSVTSTLWGGGGGGEEGNK